MAFSIKTESFRTLTAAVWFLWVLTLGAFLYTIPETVNKIKMEKDGTAIDPDKNIGLKVAGWAFITIAMLAALYVAIQLARFGKYSKRS